MYTVTLSKAAEKQTRLLAGAGLERKAKELLNILRENPFQSPPPYEKLTGELRGAYSRRINRKHRLIYEVYEQEKIVLVMSMWSHYE